MLVIRMQRTGRKGHAMFRVVVQDSRRTPTSGKIVAHLGSFDPHNKTLVLNKEKAAFYVEHGAQPSERVAGLLKAEGVKLPKWIKLPSKKERSVRNPEKRRSTAPAEAAEAPSVEAPAAEEAPAEEAPAEEPAAEVEPASEAPAEETAKEIEAAAPEEPAAEAPEKPAEEAAAEEPKEDKKED